MRCPTEPCERLGGKSPVLHDPSGRQHIPGRRCCAQIPTSRRIWHEHRCNSQISSSSFQGTFDTAASSSQTPNFFFGFFTSVFKVFYQCLKVVSSTLSPLCVPLEVLCKEANGMEDQSLGLGFCWKTSERHGTAWLSCRDTGRPQPGMEVGPHPQGAAKGHRRKGRACTVGTSQQFAGFLYCRAPASGLREHFL